MKLNFVKKTSSNLYPVKRHLKYQELYSELHERCSSLQKSYQPQLLAVELRRFLKRE